MNRRQLERLAYKYRALAALRARREAVERQGCDRFEEAESCERRAAFRRLAREFPGCLRELDTSSAERLCGRAREAEAALAGALPADWIPVVIDYHLTLREALAVKRWLAVRLPRGGEIPYDMVEAFRARLERIARLRGEGGRTGEMASTRRHDEHAELLARHLRPPRGRILELIWEALERRHGLPRAELERLVFC